MNRVCRSAAVALVAIMALAAGGASAEEETAPAPTDTPGGSRGGPAAYFEDYDGEAVTTAGYRFVDRDGSKGKYREDYDLRRGFRLFNLSLTANSSKPDRTGVDRLHLEVDTPGNEPVSHFRLMASDRERFDLRARFTRSRYKYNVPELWEAPVPREQPINDPHEYDIVRTDGVVDLTIHPKAFPTIHLGYRLYNRDGGQGNISTVFIPGGDIFLVRAPFDTITNVGLLGTTFRLYGADVFLQQEYRNVQHDMTLRDPLDPSGFNPGDASTLSAYRSDEDDTIEIPTTTVRLRRSIGERVDVSAAYRFSYAHSQVNSNRQREGTSNLPNFPGNSSASGTGDANLTTQLVDLATSVRLHRRVRFHTTYRYNDRQQDGTFNELSNAGFLNANADNDLQLHRVTAEFELQPRDDLLLRGGMRFSHRFADLSPSRQSITTDTYGAVGSLRYRPRSYLTMFAEYDNVQIDDPYRVPGNETHSPPLPDREIALTFVNRGSAGFTLKPLDWLDLRYRLTADSRDNDSFDGFAWNLGNTFSVTLNPLPGLTATTSYTWRQYDRSADILVAPLFEVMKSSQNGTENVLVSVLRYDFKLFGQQWAGGWTVSFFDYDSTLKPRLESDGGTKTSFDLDRIDGGVFLTLFHRWLEPSVEFRMIDYHQHPLDENDYRATIVALKVTKRFSF